jgi:3-hydroxybenzoate 6-monooxygenase
LAVHGDHAKYVLVIGGGIGGLAAALATARGGMRVRVLERSKEFTELGAGLQLAPNATRVLARLGLLERVIEVGVLPRRLLFRNARTGKPLTSLDLTDGFRERYGAPYVVLHRSDLLNILVDACTAEGVELLPEQDVQAVTDHGDRVSVACQNGARHDGMAVIAADGLHSRTRRLFSDDAPICSGYVAYRGTMDISRVRQQVDLHDVVAWIGPGLHLVQYPLRSGMMYNQVAVFRSEQYAAGAADWGNPDELDKAFSVGCEQVREALRHMWRDRRWPMYDREPIDTWTRGRVALLGDAAHPMLQYLAQGACQAIEDAGTLATALQAHLGAGGGWPIAEAFEEYQRIRAPHAGRVQRTARFWGDTWHIGGVGAVLRDELFSRHPADDYGYTDWLYGADRA